MSLLTQPLDFHELDAAIATSGLQRIRLAAHDNRRASRRSVMDDRARSLCRGDRFAAAFAEDAGECQVDALEASKHANVQHRGWGAQRADELVGALVSLPAFAKATVHDLFQVIAARKTANVGRAYPHSRVAFDQH